MKSAVSIGLAATLLLAGAATAGGAEPQPTEWATVEGSLPDELARPEGRTRWDFRRLELGPRFERSLTAAPDGSGALVLADRVADAGGSLPATFTFADPGAGDAASRWLRPHTAEGLLDASRITRLELDRRGGAADRRLRIDVRRVGVGWADLPAGPREVVLQRALVYEAPAGSRDFRPTRMVHRWVDPRAGLVAEVDGPVGPDGRSRTRSRAIVATRVDKGAGLHIYADQIDVPPLTHVAYGYDRGNVAVASLTPEGHTTIGELAAAGAWDFSGTNMVNSVAEVASTKTLVSADETCSYDKCGFTRPLATLAREDKNFDDLDNLNVTLSAQERENRPGDVTIWLRAGVTNEGESGAAVGDGENRLCYVDEGRTEVPLFRFAHQDANGFYLQDGDTWAHTPFACELDIFALAVCPEACGTFCPNRVFACSGHPGVQSNEVIGEGPITLPSGHTFNALLVRNVADFCVSPFAGCPSLFAQDVRTVVYLWIVPYLGTVTRLMSGVSEPDVTSFTTLAETDIKFGLFPPRSISVTGTGETSLEIAWDPGTDTHRIDGYRVYWDTDSGADSGYAFDSFSQSGQVQVAGTTATITGLEPGTEYFVTVTAVSEFTNPRTGVPTTYESLLYPTTVSALPSPVPAEVTATTAGGACAPTVEVAGLTVDRAASGIEICWDVAEDPCRSGYQVLGADAPESEAGFSVLVPDTGAVTCQTLDPTAGYFLAIGSGAGGTGPWGHFDR